MLYNAMQIADYIINKCYLDKNPISNLQLQKILYFTWVEYYQKTGRALFFDSICAWTFGPVVPDVYYEYCAYGGRPINVRCETEIDENDKGILDEIIDKYANIPVNVLVAMTHQEGTAWDVIFDGGKGNRKKIPFELIKQKENGRNYVS